MTDRSTTNASESGGTSTSEIERIVDCAGCGRAVNQDKNEIPLGYEENAPDGTTAVNLVLCEKCRFRAVQELLSGGWGLSAHKVEAATDQEGSQ